MIHNFSFFFFLYSNFIFPISMLVKLLIRAKIVGRCTGEADFSRHDESFSSRDATSSRRRIGKSSVESIERYRYNRRVAISPPLRRGEGRGEEEKKKKTKKEKAGKSTTICTLRTCGRDPCVYNLIISRE